MAIYELDGQAPELPSDGNYFIADTATVIGKVRLHNSASVWFGAVLRGDNEWIEIGEGSNVQDNSTCHTDMGFPLTIGKNCTVGHNVILHGCTLEDGALVGMGSIVMNGARIGRGSIVGAGSVITEGKQFPEYSVMIGAPARVIRTLEPAQVASTGMPCFLSTSANASSASSWMVAIRSRANCFSLSKVSSSKAINLRTCCLFLRQHRCRDSSAPDENSSWGRQPDRFRIITA